MMRVFNIGFKILNGGAEAPACDETQFDIEDTGDFSEMMTELVELFYDFCAENDFNSVQISYIEEVYPPVSPERITVPLANGFKLIAERNTDPNYRNEIFIGVRDGNGVWWQDLAVVRNAYQICGDNIVWKDEEFDVFVYSDENNEDFTHDFSIGLYHGGV